MHEIEGILMSNGDFRLRILTRIGGMHQKKKNNADTILSSHMLLMLLQVALQDARRML